MNVGDLVAIYYGWPGPESNFWIDTTGLIVAITGYKTEVLVEDEIQYWNIRDLEEMEKDKNESR